MEGCPRREQLFDVDAETFTPDGVGGIRLLKGQLQPGQQPKAILPQCGHHLHVGPCFLRTRHIRQKGNLALEILKAVPHIFDGCAVLQSLIE